MRAHNITSITIEPDVEGTTFTCRVKVNGSDKELVLNGEAAIPCFYTLSNIATEAYEDPEAGIEEETETVH